eukprot:Rhum_TRINITY_DN14339_c1_g1::Rhum_TRINITY_DN14339_c1_g1_i1::g.81541::m.81541
MRAFLFTVVFFLSLSIAAGVTVPAQKAALVSMYNSMFSGAAWGRGWPNGDPCNNSWRGVKCDGGGRIVSLLLNDVKMKNQPMVDLSPLKNLVTLGLSSTGITGLVGVPPTIRTLSVNGNAPGLGTFPQALSVVTNMVVLEMSGSRLSGTLPAFVAKWPYLRTFSVFNNNLKGSLPWKGNFPVTLESIMAHNNAFTGTLPAGVKVRFLLLSANRFTGTIPAYPRVVTLKASGCKYLSGNFDITKYPIARLIDVSGNTLGGTLPSTFPAPLEFLYMGNNRLTGTVPTTWASKSLVHLYLQKNKLTGITPSKQYLDTVCGVGSTANAIHRVDTNCFNCGVNYIDVNRACRGPCFNMAPGTPNKLPPISTPLAMCLSIQEANFNFACDHGYMFNPNVVVQYCTANGVLFEAQSPQLCILIPRTDVPPTPAPPTEVPDTAVPPTDVPATATPPTDVPDTVAPDTLVPATDVPETEIPDTLVPETDAPLTDAPPTDTPSTDVPDTQTPPTDAPATDAPVTDIPETDVPPTSEPETQAPLTDAPATDVPDTVAPDTLVPATGVPQTEIPDTLVPETDAPLTDAPPTDTPSTDVPDTQTPPTDAPA